MQCLKRCICSLTSNYKSTVNSVTLSKPSIFASTIHTSPKLQYADDEDSEPKKWLAYNDIIFPPQEPGEKRRPAFVNHMKTNIKYSPKNMWYIACLVRGMSVDEAVKQLSFCSKKGAVAVRETILEAQQIAVEKHNVEFKTNLWVSASFSSKGKVIKGLRRHAKGRAGTIHYRHVHYFVKLEEGTPPKHYYLPEPKTKEDLLNEWLIRMRRRRVSNAL